VPRRLIFIVFALLLSVGAFFLAQQWFHGRPAPIGQPVAAAPASVRVMVAKADLPVGAILDAQSVRWQDWPGDDAPADYIVQGRGLAPNLTGAIVRAHLVAGEPIVPAEVARTGDKSAMAAMLSPGTRAVTINVNASSGLAGFLTPGDRVDVIVSMAVPNKGGQGNPRRVSQTILSNLRIVGIDQALSDDKKGDPKAIAPPKTVSLEVTPKQAEILAVAIDLGVINLSLHSLASRDEADRAAPVTQTWDTDATHGVYTHPAEAPDPKPVTQAAGLPHFERRVFVVRGDGGAAEVAIPGRPKPAGATQ
jgi:pilus assembly protein CpaB